MNKNTLHIETIGELGNQLFCWAVGYSIAITRNKDLALHFRDNPCRLNEFALIDNDFLEIFEHGNFSIDMKLLARIKRRITRKYWTHETGLTIYQEAFPHIFDPEVYRLCETNVLKGYFQSWKYIWKYRMQIREELSLNSPSMDFLKLQQQLSRQDFISVHIRRGASGPSVINSQIHGFLPVQYYNHALSIIREMDSDFQNKRIVVFTDNVEITSKFIQSLDFKVDIVIGPGDLNSQSETLHLISNGFHQVGANSSYSWWSAFLSSREGINIFPRPWYKDTSIDDREILPPTWISIGFDEFLGEV